MRAFFGNACDLVDEVGTAGTFEIRTESGNSKFFHYCIEHGSNPGGLEEFVLSDACGRSVPVDIESLGELISALQDLQDRVDLFNNAQEVLNQLLDEDEVVFYDEESVSTNS
jgi:hypothetical protein